MIAVPLRSFVNFLPACGQACGRRFQVRIASMILRQKCFLHWLGERVYGVPGLEGLWLARKCNVFANCHDPVAACEAKSGILLCSVDRSEEHTSELQSHVNLVC